MTMSCPSCKRPMKVLDSRRVVGDTPYVWRRHRCACGTRRTSYEFFGEDLDGVATKLVVRGTLDGYREIPASIPRRPKEGGDAQAPKA